MVDSPLIVTVSGGSCSGKTTFASMLVDMIGQNQCLSLLQDNYYIDYGGGSPDSLGNFDAPSAIDFDLLVEHLKRLKRSEAIKVPVYDFVERRRRHETRTCIPMPVILLDGILVLNNPDVRKASDYTIFLECDEQTRLDRRIERDILHRGRTEQSVRDQFEVQVGPMHNQFVEPSKQFADLVIGQAEFNELRAGKSSVALAPLFQLIKRRVAEPS